MKKYYFESSVCRESDAHLWETFIQISDDTDLISSITFDDCADPNATVKEMCHYFLTHTPQVISGCVKQCNVLMEIHQAAFHCWELNRKIMDDQPERIVA